MTTMKRLTQLVKRSSFLRNKKILAQNLNIHSCCTLFNTNSHSYQQIDNNNKEFKNKNVHFVDIKQSVIHCDTKNLWSKVDQIFPDDLPDMKALYPEIVKEIINGIAPFSISESITRFKHVLEYNISGGKNLRSSLLIKTYTNLKKDINATDLKLAYILGWCLNVMHSACLMIDDIMDASETRRKQLCWYKVKNVGLMAINDGVLIEHSVYYLLRKHFSHLDCYIDLLNLFHDVLYITTCGEANDILSANNNVETYTRDRYFKIALHKTAYCTFYMPIIAAMHLSGCKEKHLYDAVKNILLEIGVLFQIQDDILDCFGSKETTGKIGTDISGNKCTWLAAECMQRANENQKMIMKKCYGSNDPEKVAQVKQVYLDLDLLRIYTDYERETFHKIQQLLNEAPESIPKEILFKILAAFVNK